MTDTTQITVEKADGIATITLNRPEKMNAYTRTMGAEIMAAMDEIDDDDDVRAVIFTGAGEKAFCAGADLTPEGGGQVFSSGEEVKDLSDERVRDGGGLLTLRLFESKKPLISACNGVAVGVGATMQLAMDIRLASDNARFGFVFARRGIVPEAASSWFLPRIVGISQALEWCYTGRVFDAAEAKEGGLVRSVHSPGTLMSEARELAREIAQNTSAVSIAMTRAMMWRLMNADHPMEAHKIDSRAIYRLSRGADAKEGIASFLEKRPPNYPAKVSEDMPDFYPWWEQRRYE
ncbi:crotonase/enoyl-CoA hydratase family protein [Erythrobacter sp. THAF29]|uniref:crotonase/enoyl-CoA hydratase family protein n=1 Tax=Erythrobacter sp. THAF29 TaxID=2587851 RepID=UPI0012687021|nr:crotonase/enoyl-CoA hydratase family protein [Erythrobacter sp. THAF29]QFT77011.1 putative enoyl-CoA hydratase echA8 [Erythrobacter sp. THAF29]